MMLLDEHIIALRRDGFAVIPGVIPSDDCDAIRELLEQETVEAYGLPSRRDLDAALPSIIWRNQKVANLHGRGMWTVRTHPGVVSLYKNLWHALLPRDELIFRGIERPEDLPTVTSFDGFVLSCSTSSSPSSSSGTSRRRGKNRFGSGSVSDEWHPAVRGWLHADQSVDHVAPIAVSPSLNSGKNDNAGEKSDPSISIDYDPRVEACVQGQVVLSDASEMDAGFVCLEGSHRLWDEAIDRFGGVFASRGTRSYFNMIDDEAFAWFTKDRGCRHVKVPARKGSMILWYSTTIHAGSGPTARDYHNTHHSFSSSDGEAASASTRGNMNGISKHRSTGRAVAFVSQAPAWFSTCDDWAKRAQAIAENRGTSHWTHGPGLTLNGLNPIGLRRGGKGASNGNGVVKPQKTIPVWHFADGTPERELQLALIQGE